MRLGLALVLLAFVATDAEARRTKTRKPKYSREQVRTESLAAWPGRTEADSRPQPVGVPEIDRLLMDRPCIGVSVNEPEIELVERSLARDGRPSGVANAFLGTLDPVQKIREVAEPLLGSPYRSGGNSTSGIDCSGFVLTVLKGLGQDLTGRSSGEFWKQGNPV
ncbi:MAG TPA: NlpC/P60 family protein, partial [Fibrobacteria bacterium]|nr:NlpC/P60 family protein [Fibrobacteria bacterium]